MSGFSPIDPVAQAMHERVPQLREAPRADRRAQPLAVVSFDRRKLDGDDDDTEQWAYDGPTIKRHLQDWEDATLRDEAGECAREGLPPGVTRFVLLGRWVGSYDAWTGEHDAWIEDRELVPLRSP